MILEIFGEAFLSAVVGSLFERLSSPLIEKFFGGGDRQKLFEKLRRDLLTVNAVLSDAEEKQITNLKVKEWINQLKDAAYQADDLLDEIDTIGLRRKLEDEAKVKGKAKDKGKGKVMGVMAKQVDVVWWCCSQKRSCCPTLSLLFESADFKISHSWAKGCSTSPRWKSWRSAAVRSSRRCQHMDCPPLFLLFVSKTAHGLLIVAKRSEE